MSNRMSNTATGGESIRQVTAGQSRVILALVCAASLMCATSARAEPPSGPRVTRTVTDEQNEPFADNNPCIGGALVSGTGHLHTVFIDRSTATRVDTTYRFQHNGEATTPNDTAEYRFKSSGDIDLKSSTKNFVMTTRTRERIIRDGNRRSDDYSVWSSYRMSGLDPKPVVVRESSGSSCR